MRVRLFPHRGSVRRQRGEIAAVQNHAQGRHRPVAAYRNRIGRLVSRRNEFIQKAHRGRACGNGDIAAPGRGSGGGPRFRRAGGFPFAVVGKNQPQPAQPGQCREPERARRLRAFQVRHGGRESVAFRAAGRAVFLQDQQHARHRRFVADEFRVTEGQFPAAGGRQREVGRAENDVGPGVRRRQRVVRLEADRVQPRPRQAQRAAVARMRNVAYEEAGAETAAGGEQRKQVFAGRGGVQRRGRRRAGHRYGVNPHRAPVRGRDLDLDEVRPHREFDAGLSAATSVSGPPAGPIRTVAPVSPAAGTSVTRVVECGTVAA